MGTRQQQQHQQLVCVLLARVQFDKTRGNMCRFEGQNNAIPAETLALVSNTIHSTVVVRVPIGLLKHDWRKAQTPLHKDAP